MTVSYVDNGNAALIRVTRMVDSEPRQAYFNLRNDSGELVSTAAEDDILRTARALDERWHREQLTAQERRRREQVPTQRQEYPFCTSARGITLRMEVKRRARRTSFTPTLRSGVAGLRGTTMGIVTRGVTRAWKEMYARVCEAQDIPVQRDVLESPPPIAQLKALRARFGLPNPSNDIPLKDWGWSLPNEALDAPWPTGEDLCDSIILPGHRPERLATKYGSVYENITEPEPGVFLLWMSESALGLIQTEEFEARRWGSPENALRAALRERKRVRRCWTEQKTRRKAA